MPEFTDVGKHCGAENCNQQDFLPFECDCCNGTFCLSHRSYAAHSCAASGNKDFRALVCPLCKKTVRFNGGQDPNQQWDLHTRTDCNPEDYKRNKPTKKRCAAASCRVVLGPTNTQRCASCGKETCLTHRFPDSHNCSASSRGDARGSAAAAAARRMAAQANQSRPMSLREKAAQNRAAASSRADANTARATADRRRRENPAAQARSFGGSGGQSEQCPQCGATFGDIGSLVAHAEAFHSEGQQFRAHGGGGGGGSSSAGETCPICNLHFADVALLVSHVEAVHPDGARGFEFAGRNVQRSKLLLNMLTDRSRALVGLGLWRKSMEILNGVLFRDKHVLQHTCRFCFVEKSLGGKSVVILCALVRD